MDQFVNSFYFIEKCRVCESEDKYIDLLKNINLLENFENLADQKVEENDGLSQWLCKACFQKVDEFVKFRKKCQKTYEKYRSGAKEDLSRSFDPLDETMVQTNDETERLLEDTELLELKQDDGLENILETMDQDIQSAGGQEPVKKTEECQIVINKGKGCQFCGKMFRNKSNLVRHEQSVHLNKKYKCELCFRNFTQSSSLKEHKRKLHNFQSTPTSNSTTDNEEVSNSKSTEEIDNLKNITFEENLEEFHPLIQHTAEEFSQEFDSRIEEIVGHFDISDSLINVDPTDSLQSTNCASSDDSASHSNAKVYSCKSCDKNYSHSNNLSRHVQIAHNNQSHKCDVCGRAFTQKGSLLEHKKNIHAEEGLEEKFECSLCKKVLNTYKMLTQHMKRHESGKATSKTSTPLSTGLIDSANTSNMTTKQLRRYRKLCPFCGKFYKHLEEHIYLHTGEKNHVCEICNKKFTFKTTLTAHLRIHSGEKPFNCSVCNKQFRASHHLKEHQYIHSGIKQFNCKICLKSFATKLTFYKHSKIHNSPINLVGNSSYVIPYDISLE